MDKFSFLARPIIAAGLTAIISYIGCMAIDVYILQGPIRHEEAFLIASGSGLVEYFLHRFILIPLFGEEDDS